MQQEKLVAVFGLLVMLGVAFALSRSRKSIRWKTIAMGTGIQFAFALLILKTPWGRWLFAKTGDVVSGFLAFSDAGASFLFGENFAEHFFAFKVLSTIIFFSSVIALAYHLGLVQRVVKVFAWAMMRLMGTSGSESLSASANIFVGQTEAPILVRPYVPTMTQSELMAVMTGGFATIAGGVMAAYVGMGVSAGHLLAASVMSAPAALVMAKLMQPETEESVTAGEVKVAVETPYVNLVDAAAEGASSGVQLALNVGGMLIAFVAMIAAANWIVGWCGGLFGFEGWSLEAFLGALCSPLAWLMGVPWAEAGQVGTLIGIKTAANEFVGYLKLQEMAAAGLSERSQYIATYALCGFSNFSSIAIQIGGIGAMAPERKGDLARLGFRAMVAGSLACFQTATIAGILL